MIQIFFIGSSGIYGVGGENGGYADLVKQTLHKKMYGKDGIGEKYEIYNFGKSGATIDFVLETFPQQLNQYGRGGKTIAVVKVGGNNAKAENKPDNFISTLEEYSQEIEKLLDLLKEKCTSVIAIGSAYYDESKTNPKPNPLAGGKPDFFSNKRSKKFQERFKQICGKKGVVFIDLGVSEKEWIDKYIYEDGLHANSKGHEMISKKILSKLEELLK